MAVLDLKFNSVEVISVI